MGTRALRLAIVVMAIVFAGAEAAAAQAAAEQDKQAAPAAQRLQTPVTTAPAAKGTVGRWFDLQAASVIGRYRRVETSTGVVASNHLQDSLVLRARFKFDSQAAYSVNVAVGTGTGFTSGYNNTGWGTGGGRVLKAHVRHLFVAAAPIKGIECSLGGFGFARGQSTEITSYDNDGFLMGERVTLKRAGELYFDEISFTNAYLGDVNVPNVFDRFRRVDEPNYRQALVAKQLAKWLAVSGDYTRLEGVGTLRAAVTARTPQARIVDLLRYEEYRRLGATGAYGFAAYAEKLLVKRMTVSGGYADIDAGYGGLNGDRYNRGRRFFGQATMKLTADLSASFFVTRARREAYLVSNRTRFDVVVAYNAVGPIQRAGLLR